VNSSTALSSQDSFALAAQNHNIYVFSFLTGTTITSFYAHDDIIHRVIFVNVRFTLFIGFNFLIEPAGDSVIGSDPQDMGLERV
jgi:hypothetical protein